MATKLELEEYLYRRALDIIESPDTDKVKESLLFQEVWLPLADLYNDKIKVVRRNKKTKTKTKAKVKVKKKTRKKSKKKARKKK